MTKIMNWNIQNFGEKRSKGATVVELIAYQVAKLDVDILVLIELNTSKPDVAIKILRDRLIPRIESQYKNIHQVQQSFRFTISAQSAYKGAESYAYIYKSTIQACALDNSHDDEYADLTEPKFVTTNNSTTYNAKSTAVNKKSNFFPLMEDYSNSWYGRSCCFGAFRLPDSSFLFIVSLHNAANLAQAGHNLHIYDVHDVLDAPIDVSINGNLVTTGATIFTGDFNVNYLGKNKERIYYEEMAKQSHYGVYIDRLTHLKGYQGSKEYANSYDLRSYCFDNFLIVPSVLNPVNEKVVDIPAWIKSDKKVYKTMIGDTNLVNTGEMNSLARESISTWIKKNIPAKKRQASMIDVIIKAKIKFNRIDNNSINALEQLCTNEQMFRTLMEEINGILAHCTRQLFRFAELSLSNRNKLKWYEALLLSRLISDHLPVCIEV